MMMSTMLLLSFLFLTCQFFDASCMWSFVVIRQVLHGYASLGNSLVGALHGRMQLKLDQNERFKPTLTYIGYRYDDI